MPDQPIPPAALADLYVLQLEHQLMLARIAQQQAMAQQLEARFNALAATLAEEHGVTLNEWTFDLQNRTMTKKS